MKKRNFYKEWQAKPKVEPEEVVTTCVTVPMAVLEKWDPAPKIEHKQYIDSCIVVPARMLEFEEN